MVEHERVRSVPRAGRVEEAVEKGVTRCTPPRFVLPRLRIFEPEIVSQRELEVGMRGYPLTLRPKTTLPMYDASHLHTQDLMPPI